MQTDYLDKNILVVDTIDSGLSLLIEALPEPPARVEITNDIEEAQAVYLDSPPDLLIVAVEPTQTEGLQIIQWVHQQGQPVAIIAASFNASAEFSAGIIRSGATDILNLDGEQTVLRLDKRIRRTLSLIKEQRLLSDLTPSLFDESQAQFIGSSQSMREVARLIMNAAKSNASVFITGENGTGKEVCAQLIHEHSRRNEHELVAVNCAAIPHNLAESELFGHTKGSFTGAISDRQGVAKQADCGTLFLDEIGEMEMDIQSKLLRFIQTGTYTPVGSNLPDKVDVRFICATNRDPNDQIAAGNFRQDLFYRLNVVQIHLPPLRERGNDILILARKFLSQFSKEEGKQFTSFSGETEKLLLSYSWPGNIRELQNIIRNIAVLYDGTTIIPSMLPLAIVREKGDRRRRAQDSPDASRSQMLEQLKASLNKMSEQSKGISSPGDIRPLEDIITESIREAIDACNGNITEASLKLGISPSTVYRRLKNT